MSYFSKFKKETPRKQTSKITAEKEKPKHISKKSTAILGQELLSLINIKPAFRDSNWKTKWNAVKSLMREAGIWDGFEQKYKLSSSGLDTS